MSNFSAEIFDPGLLQGRSSQGQGRSSGASGKVQRDGSIKLSNGLTLDNLGNEKDDDSESDESDIAYENGQMGRNGIRQSATNGNNSAHSSAAGNSGGVGGRSQSGAVALKSHGSLSIIPNMPVANLPLKPSNSLKGKSIVYRIFHMGDTTPTGSEEDQYLTGKSRPHMGGYGSGSESDCYSDGDDHHKNANPLARSGSTHEGRLRRKSSFGDVVEQFRNATKSLGRDASRKKNHHGIFSQHQEESSDYESEENDDNYKEYVGKSKAGKSKSSVSLLKDFLHFSSSHSLTKSSKSKHGSQPSLSHHNSTTDVQQRSSITSASPQHPPSSIFQKTSPMKQDSSVVASPAHYQSPPDIADDHFSTHNHFSLERQPSPSGSSVCSSGTTPPLYPTAPPSSKFKDLLLPPPASSGGRRSSLGSQRSTGSSQDDHHVPGHAPSRSSSELNLKEKYGNVSNVLGKGAFATVKLCCPVGSKEKYAVKEFRKKKKDESTKEYIKKLQAEFCIASSMDHENIVKCIDLIQDSKGAWCVVMDFCQDGDLFARISNGSLTSEQEKSCYFVQLVHGVSYLHSIGVAHRDLKPENILVQGNILKITDFGVSTVFKNPFGAKREKQKGITGSGPYIAPEEWTDGEYDSELVDIWAIGIIGYVMASNSIPWRCAQMTDTRFRLYTESQKKFAPFERIMPGLRKLMYKILEPDPSARITMKDILADEWLSSVEVCTSSTLDRMMHSHSSHSTK